MLDSVRVHCWCQTNTKEKLPNLQIWFRSPQTIRKLYFHLWQYQGFRGAEKNYQPLTRWKKRRTSPQWHRLQNCWVSPIVASQKWHHHKRNKTTAPEISAWSSVANKSIVRRNKTFEKRSIRTVERRNILVDNFKIKRSSSQKIAHRWGKHSLH